MMEQINNLIIEVTRKCNMQCSHCLRGDLQNMNIDLNHITTLLNRVKYISMVTFSGGEPSLNTEAIKYFLDKAKENKVNVGSFYIATNGKSVKSNFVITALELFAYCDEKEMCTIDVSNDYFHANEGNYNTELLSGLSFFKRKHEEEAQRYKGINEGYYLDNFGDGRENTVENIYTQDDFQDANIYLNCKGKIINGCDWSYKNQENNILCDVSEISDYYSNLEGEY